jgi:hypothetical protein
MTTFAERWAVVESERLGEQRNCNSIFLVNKGRGDVQVWLQEASRVRSIQAQLEVRWRVE